MIRYVLPALITVFSTQVYSQNIFSEGEFDYKKPFAPYEIPLVKSLDFHEFILLNEYKKGVFKLSRFDEYFIDKWSQTIDFENTGSFPVLLKIDNEAIIFRFWTHQNNAHVEIQRVNINTGDLINKEHKIVAESEEEIGNYCIKFSANNTKFLVYNRHPNTTSQNLLDVYSTTHLEKEISYKFISELTNESTIFPFLGDNGELFLASADAGNFSLEVYYFTAGKDEPIKLSSNFAFKRPADHFPSISIVKQSESTYLVMLVANIENEIVGINISSFNVVLKSHLLSVTYDIDPSFIASAYQGSLFTSENQKKKWISTPKSLINFDAQEVFLDNNGNLTAIFEQQDIPSTYHNINKTLNFGLKWKETEDIFYTSGDLLLLNFNAEGELSWKKVIQKYQRTNGNGLTLSYLSNFKTEDELQLIMKESAKGNSLYYFNIDLFNGNIISKQSFIEDKMEINKNYCAWLDDKTLLLCGNKPGSTRRKYYFLEF